jgi:acyl carrier protein
MLVLAGDRRCGVGEPGEIVVRTPYRSLGYLRAEEPGSARFVPNPFRDDHTDLVYRTGDKGRFRPDGELEILGRIDDQVKLRGMRIEPSEIKVCLEAHPALEEAEVLVRKDAAGEARLVGYYVIVGGVGAEAPTVSELRRFLGERLPDYMIPGAFVRLDAFPLNPSGKVDRARLPEPGADRPELDAPYQAPQSRLERLIAEVWREALKVEQVGVADNFFDLGGHSLLMVEIRGKLEPALGREVSLVDLFRHPSVGALARHLTQQQQPDRAPDRAGYDRADARRQAATRRQARPAATRTVTRRTT